MFGRVKDIVAYGLWSWRFGREFGWRLMWQYCLLPWVDHRPGRALKRNSHIKDWIYKTYRHRFDEAQNWEFNTSPQAEAPIWVFWWQGEADMPPIVRACVQSIKTNAGGSKHPVRVIDKDNIGNYIELPETVINHVRNGDMSLTNLSDVCRCQLLAKHGGLWMDATIFTTQQVNEELFNRPFTSLRQAERGDFTSRCRWSTFLLGGLPNTGNLASGGQTICVSTNYKYLQRLLRSAPGIFRLPLARPHHCHSL